MCSNDMMACRQNQALEIDWAAMLDEKFRLQQEAKALAQHLNALLNDKFGPQSGKGFDSDTPISKLTSSTHCSGASCHC